MLMCVVVYMLLLLLYVGVPDSSLPFSFAQLNGVRLAVPVVDPALVAQATERFKAVVEDTFEPVAAMSGEDPGEEKKKYLTRGFSIYSLDELSERS